MPFTFSHPGFFLPFVSLRARWYSVTGLLIGSMTPDFEYFFRLQTKSTLSHTLPGVFLFDLPMGFLAAFLFHNGVRNALIENLPAPFQRRFAPFLSFDWNRYAARNWLIIALSLLVGVFSHILIDSFTHEHLEPVKQIAFLRTPVPLPILGEFPLFRLLQHGGSLLGALLILFFIWRLPVSDAPVKPIDWRYWLVAAGVVLYMTLTLFLFGLSIRDYQDVVATISSAGLAALLITPILLGKWRTSDDF